jgi:hypothetical protein
MFNKICLLIVSVAISLIVGCGTSPTSANGITPELKQDATSIVKVMDANMDKNHNLKGKDDQEYDSFLRKYDQLRKQAEDQNYLDKNGSTKAEVSESVKLVQRIIKMRELLAGIEIDKGQGTVKSMYNDTSNEIKQILGMTTR